MSEKPFKILILEDTDTANTAPNETAMNVARSHASVVSTSCTEDADLVALRARF